MTYVLAIQKVEDYDKWKPVFDDHGTIRMAKGSMGASVLRNVNDPNQLVIITEWENMESAKNFALDKDLKTVMKKAGVIGHPELYYLDKIEQTQY